MMKRLFDLVASSFGLILTSPLLLLFMLLVWLQDFHSPFYIAERVGKDGKPFNMIKLRSMVVNAAKSGVTSTSADDQRITVVGKLIRALKLDEITQLINVFLGDMSLVGPRPNVMRWGVELYTDEEKGLLSVRPGITDFASIVFSDEGHILAGRDNPDLAYNQLIRPWKSRLSLHYIKHQSLWLDIQLVLLTVVAIISKSSALKSVVGILNGQGASEEMLAVASRSEELQPHAPPGSSEIVSEL
ncbi:MAG: sugar transferase [Gammaproteobacteria bacterium]